MLAMPLQVDIKIRRILAVITVTVIVVDLEASQSGRRNREENKLVQIRQCLHNHFRVWCVRHCAYTKATLSVSWLLVWRIVEA